MEISTGVKLGNIAKKLHLYDLALKIGIEAFFYRKAFKSDLLDAQKFYEKPENKIRVDKVIQIFADECSVQSYKKAIAFRQYHTLETRPPKCKEEEYFNSLTNILDTNEVFIDCGGFTGDTVEAWCKFVNNQYKKIVVFEPDKENYRILQDNIKSLQNCIVYNAGVWKENGTVSFSENNTAGSRVENTNKGGIQIETLALDRVEDCKDATFIKMDIEGSELNALNGALNIIKNNRPILTICLYHTNEDMISIPEWMDKNLEHYRYYCRHHSYHHVETILYAIPEERYK